MVSSVRKFGLSIGGRLAMLDLAWKTALAAFLGARILYSIWAIVAVQLNPQRVNNLDLFGAPVLAVFDTRTSERFAYSRDVDGTILQFLPGEDGFVVDSATNSTWSLSDGRSTRGTYRGRALDQAIYSAEDIFPYHRVLGSANPWLAPWQRFDANWYLKIASQGYSADDGSAAFFPLYPVLIRAGGFILLGNDLLAAILISNGALIGVLYLLFQMTRELVGEGAAVRTVTYLVLFPTAFFFFGSYTESLFLLLALLSLRAGSHKRWLACGFFGALAGLTRPQGLVLFVPAVYLWWRMRPSESGRMVHWFTLLPILLIPLGTAVFIVLMNFTLFSSVQWRNSHFVLPWQPLIHAVSSLARGQIVLPDVLNLIFTVLFALFIVLGWTRMPIAYSLFAAAMLVAPLFRLTPSQPLVSMSRYVLPIFPVFILLGQWGQNEWSNRLILYSSVPLGLFLSAQFVLWGWVA